MFDFNEELERFEPSTEADLSALELTGDEATDMHMLLRLLMQEGQKRIARQFDQLGLEDM